jgi:hydrogenase-4 component F
MILGVLLAVPLIAALLLLRVRPAAARLVHALAVVGLLGAAAAVVGAVAQATCLTALGGLLRADALSAWMIGLIALVGTLAACEVPRHVPPGRERTFYPCFHLFLFTMLLAVATDDVGVMWVAVEGTTLASVFLVNIERTRASLEASYKYLLICSVGIALAFVGTVLVYFTDLQVFGDEAHALRWTTLMRLAPSLSPDVLQQAFVFVLVGYGTKAGLAPMHTWLPDAHSEAPAPASALMSGVLLAVGIYAILRFKPVVDAAAGPVFAQRLLLALGLVSMIVAAAFLWSPTNYKRMLAYSSVEHMGLVCLGLGFGGAWALAGAILHVANHALAKSALFLLAGRIRAAMGSAEIAAVAPLASTRPRLAASFLVLLLALLGVPPFGLFVSELMILGGGFQQGYRLVPCVTLALLLIAFGGMLRAGHRMLYAPSAAGRGVEARPATPERQEAWAPVGAALVLLVVTGIIWPPGLAKLLDHIATLVAR